MTVLGNWPKPRGPVKQFTSQLNYRCDDEMYAALKARAKTNHTTISDLIRTYIEWGLENDEGRKDLRP